MKELEINEITNLTLYKISLSSYFQLNTGVKYLKFKHFDRTLYLHQPLEDYMRRLYLFYDKTINNNIVNIMKL